MFTAKQKWAAAAAAITLGFGLVSGAPAFAHPENFSLDGASLSSVEKQEQQSFTGYVISKDDKHILVADVPSKEEALSYQENWWELAYQNKLLKVPVSSDAAYEIGDKLKVTAKALTKSIPPIAISSVIEHIGEE